MSGQSRANTVTVSCLWLGRESLLWRVLPVFFFCFCKVLTNLPRLAAFGSFSKKNPESPGESLRSAPHQHDDAGRHVHDLFAPPPLHERYSPTPHDACRSPESLHTMTEESVVTMPSSSANLRTDGIDGRIIFHGLEAQPRDHCISRSVLPFHEQCRPRFSKTAVFLPSQMGQSQR